MNAIYQKFIRVKQHPLMAELRLCLQRLRITRRLCQLNAQERRTAIELAFQRAYAARLAENLQLLRQDNNRQRAQYRQQMEQLMEGGHAQ